MRKAMIIGALTLAGSLASPAFADEHSGFRLGISIGQESLESDVGYTGLGVDKLDTSRFGYSVFGGWALNKWIAFEAAYSGGGDFNQTLFIDPAFPNRDFATHYDVQAFVGSAVGSWWVTPKFGLFGRVGVYGWKGTLDVAFDNDSAVAPPYAFTSYDDDGFEPLLGVGVQTELDGALVRFEYSMTEFDDHAAPGIALADTTLTSLNLSIVWFLH